MPIASCPVCAWTHCTAMLDLGSAAIFCNVQWRSRDEALSAVKGPIRLASCTRCGHVFNTEFDAEAVAYAPGYENSQHSSTVFADYAEGLVERLVSTYALRGRAIVDIGCGRGDLLRMLSRRALGKGYGFDPSFAGADAAPVEQNVRIVREYFDAQHAKRIQPALVCCRHVLEHVPAPVDFLRALRAAVEQSDSCILYIEVPNGTHLWDNGGVWDVLYEHFSYFSAHSLRLALQLAGFNVLNLHEAFGGQFLCAEAVAAPVCEPNRQVPEGEFAGPLPSGAARDRMVKRVERWRDWTAEAASRGRTVAIWGAGSKGVTFLNLLNLRYDGPVQRVLDQNPAKSGLYVSCTGQRISTPSIESVAGVSAIVLMNSIYGDEVKARLTALGSRAELLFADQ